jgi:hypothetical protein
MYLKSLAIFENPSHSLKKASISLKMSSKESKSLKSLKFSENILKKPQNCSKCLAILEKASSNVLKMPQIFEKPHITLKKPQFYYKCV